MRVGDSVRVVLDSTYWQFAALTATSVVRQEGSVVYARGSCDLGMGCGTATLTLAAIGPGTAVITAHRNACGEALACTPAEADYSVTLSVR